MHRQLRVRILLLSQIDCSHTGSQAGSSQFAGINRQMVFRFLSRFPLWYYSAAIVVGLVSRAVSMMFASSWCCDDQVMTTSQQLSEGDID
jgi:hypothetical protein